VGGGGAAALTPSGGSLSTKGRSSKGLPLVLPSCRPTVSLTESPRPPEPC
jgi:hypothetical protein